jgi:preprotein translocase subunit SecE
MADKEIKAKTVEKKDKKPGLFKKLAQWFKETKSELKKVVWPSFKQVANNTLVVLLVVVATALCIGLFDMLFKFVAGFIAS